MMITNVRGSFSNVQGTVVWDPEDVAESSIDVTIDTTTLNTGDPNRDTHVKSAEFLEIEKHPAITFKSKTITKVGGSATSKIKRSDFGLTWNAALETGGVMLGDDVKIELDVSLIKA
jgi:polyisoprenoid-binding protein YceI